MLHGRNLLVSRSGDLTCRDSIDLTRFEPLWFSIVWGVERLGVRGVQSTECLVANGCKIMVM